MKAPPFRYVRPDTLAEALELLAQHGDDARVLAGGQSLLPMLHMRLAAPAVLVDVNRVAALQGLAPHGEGLRIGALARHAAVLAAPEVAQAAPLLAQAMPHVAHAAVRERGSFGGSACLADPAAEIPAVCVALDAVFELRSQHGAREVGAADFFAGTYATALAPDELLVAVRLPGAGPQERAGFAELSRRHGDYAVAGVCVQARLDPQGRWHGVRIVLFGVAPQAQRCAAAQRVLEGGAADDAALAEAQAVLLDGIEPVGDMAASAQTKRHLAVVQFGRVVRQLRRQP